jgi:hypothetical protein
MKDDSDIPFVRRIMAAYKLASASYQPSASGWDHELFEMKRDVHDALLSGDVCEVARLLRNPAETRFLWGFDSAVKNGPRYSHDRLLNALERVAVAMGAIRETYPETEDRPITYTTSDLLNAIEACLDFRLSFPNAFPQEHGLTSRCGTIGFRAIQAVYQAWRIAQIADGRQDFRVLEIGAGLGRTAYFANLFGIRDYTIIDIPLTNAAQAYFLGRTLSFDAVSLHGEQPRSSITIMPPAALAGTYDLIVNVDSWTEMSPDVAENYWRFAKQATRTVLSINHEHNPVTVRALYSNDPDVRVLRFPYWPRQGYVEELLTW